MITLGGSGDALAFGAGLVRCRSFFSKSSRNLINSFPSGGVLACMVAERLSTLGFEGSGCAEASITTSLLGTAPFLLGSIQLLSLPLLELSTHSPKRRQISFRAPEQITDSCSDAHYRGPFMIPLSPF